MNEFRPVNFRDPIKWHWIWYDATNACFSRMAFSSPFLWPGETCWKYNNSNLLNERNSTDEIRPHSSTKAFPNRAHFEKLPHSLLLCLLCCSMFIRVSNLLIRRLWVCACVCVWIKFILWYSTIIVVYGTILKTSKQEIQSIVRWIEHLWIDKAITRIINRILY